MNTHYIKRQAQKGFTLVELLIVVIILAILAAIVVPQFASSTDDAKISSLDSTLSNMRSAVDLYRQQHNAYPGDNTAVPDAANPCSGTAGTGAGGNLATFYEQLSMYTTASGMACSKQDAGYDYGPYLKKVPLAANPVTNVATVAISTAGDLDMNGDGAGLGWKYDTKTGKFIANDTNNDPDGVSYDKH